MRCRVDGCKITTKTPSQGKCWTKWNICHRHAIELHPSDYKYKVTTNRKFKRVGVRGYSGRTKDQGRYGKSGPEFMTIQIVTNKEYVNTIKKDILANIEFFRNL